jgi:hypothetical protein
MVDIAVYKCQCKGIDCEIRIDEGRTTIYCDERRANVPITEMKQIETIKRSERS